MKNDAPAGPDDNAVAARVRPAATLLMIVCVLNLATGFYCLVRAIAAKKEGPNTDFQQQWQDMDAKQNGAFEKSGWTAEAAYTTFANGLLTYGGFASLASALTVAGARHMLACQSYGLAMLSAILTAVPCLTPCCLIGQIAGVWAIIVLVQPDVRRAFH